MVDAEVSGAPLWVRIILIAAGLLGGAFIIWWLAASLSDSARNDAQRVRELATAANNLAAWPEVGRQIGRSGLFHRAPGGHEIWSGRGKVRVELYHPDFRDFSILYWNDQASCPELTEIARGRLTVSGTALAVRTDNPAEEPYLERARSASWLRPQPGNPICYRVGPLDLNAVVIERGRFQHLLLVSRPETRPAAEARPVGLSEGLIEAQIGETRLPVRDLSDLPKIESSLESVAVRTARETLAAGGAKLAPPTKTLRDALEPVDSSVEGKRFRFYFRPLEFGGAVQGSGAKDYFLVGADPAGVQSGETTLGPQTVAFTLALGVLLALVPVIKLAKLGPVDSLKPIEVAAVVFGLLTAFALGTGGWVAARDIITLRAAVSAELQQTARTIEANAYSELLGVLDSPRLRSLSPVSPPIPEMVTGHFETDRGKPFPQPDAVFLIDRNGRQPIGQAIRVARDMSGADYSVRDRGYFNRVMIGDTPAGSELLVRRTARNAQGLWSMARGGLALDQIRSRVDGVPRTILAASLRHERGNEPVAIATSFVLRSLLAPKLRAGESFAVIDSAAPGWPVLFHSETGRVGAERFADGLHHLARTRLKRMAAQPASCDGKSPAEGGHDTASATFSGIHEGAATLFGAARLRCSDWIVLTWTPRNRVDRIAVAAATHAVLLWSGLALLVVMAWTVAAVLLGDKIWCWLWPDPRTPKAEAYWQAVMILAAGSVLALLLIGVAGLALTGVAVGIVSALAALSPIALAHRQLTASLPAEAEPLARRAKLGPTIQRDYTTVIALLLLTLAALPVAGFAADARMYLAQYRAGQDLTADLDRAKDQLRREQAVARSISVQRRAELLPRPLQEPERPSCKVAPAAPGCPPAGFTGIARGLLGLDDGATFGATPRNQVAGRTSPIDRLIIFVALLGLAIVGAVALRAMLRGLFGFGVALEAVDYPPLPGLGDRSGFTLAADQLPGRFMVIAAPDAQWSALLECARTHGLVVDLFDQAETAPETLTLPEPDAGRLPLVLFCNLGTVLRDPVRRRGALRLMEHFADRQGRPPRYRIGLLAELSPLDRLLHSYERENEDLRDLDPKDRLAVQREWNKHREDMRWSRLFEEFTTYIYSAAPRRPPASFGEKPHVARTVWRELEYVPDHAVSALIPDRSPPLESEEIIAWVDATFAADTSPDATVEYLSSMLIEHYQHMWTISSRAERLLLHRFAHHHVPNLAAAFAVRSLIRRGLVVLDPYPRIMNRSFAQFVRHAERQSTIYEWRKGAEAGLWRTLRTPIALAVPLALGVLVFFSMRNGDSLVSLLPLIAAAGPALIQTLGAGRRTPAA